MTQMISDETLMAFADGELDAETSAMIESALEKDEALADRLALFLDSKALLATTMKPLIDEPLPPKLSLGVQDAIDKAVMAGHAADDTVIAFRPKPASAQPRSSGPAIAPSRASMALAASLAGILFGLAGFLAGRSAAPVMDSGVAALHAALSTLPSGTATELASGTSFSAIASFRDGDGHLCREYEVKAQDTQTTAIACHGPEGWQTRLALTNPLADGYVPASALETVESYLAALGAGEPLSLQEEADGIAALATK
ncbi:hypothetical protein FE840_009640 [Peteryoungia desertarenae]|uniref:Anti-sigma factor n=1 Tax=Peteryoungia desertarenae TaxID=1813451 RepID=A0ABX6QMM7_9HYPH|nr:hypothetical protein [Peteryoungia desertarenae]QLF69785.1 hypothetical protein FE840_009640 [Peteryoungia desertarenae]